MKRSFSKNPAARAALLKWHEELDEKDRGGRARLRRAATPEEVAYVPAFHGLLAELRPAFPAVDEPWARPRLAALAGLAARVREPAGDAPLPKQMAGSRKGSEGPVVSEARFRRLLTSSSLEDRYGQLARVLQLLGNRADLVSLADAVFDWEDDPDLRQRWAYEYYGAARP